MNFELDEILTIIDKVKTTGLDTFEYEDTDVKLKIRGQKPAVTVPQMVNAVALTGTVPAGNENTMTEEKFDYITSPMVGTFYHASSEDAAPFVSVGDKVTKGQVVGIIEAMKLMNEIQSEVEGIVEEILVPNETLAEFGQQLIRIRPL